MRALVFLMAMATVSITAFSAELAVVSAVATPTPVVADEFKKMMTALVERDYDTFVADGSPEVKAALTKQMFEGVSDQIGSRLKTGYDAQYLTQLKQQGCDVYVWKVSIKDGGDEFLAKLAMQNGKVAGFRIQ